MNSIFGTAKATQEADNVFILQALPEASLQGSGGGGGGGYGNNKQAPADDDGRLVKFLDVKKNRFEGRLGSVPLDFDEDTLVYSEVGAAAAGGRAGAAAAASAAPSPAAPVTPSFAPQQHQHPDPTPNQSDVEVVPVPVLEEDTFSILTK